MKIAIISDTHDNLDIIRETIEIIENKNVEKIVHCGDLVSPFSAKLFKNVEPEFHYIEGNNDGETNLKQLIEEFGQYYQHVAEFKIKGINIAAYHGTDEKIVNALAKSGEYNYVFRGHTHQKSDKEIDKARVINPGGIKIPNNNQEGYSFAILDLNNGNLKYHDL